MEKINIAIDGPAGAGKSTVARLVAERLGFVYVDTGAMYRAVALKALETGLDPEQVEQIAQMAAGLDIRLIPGDRGIQVLVDGRDVTEQIREPRVSRAVSEIARIPRVRELLVLKQREMAKRKGVVMDGRDIGTHVMPDAEVKVFLTASVKERAARRYAELKAKNETVTLEQLERDIAMRDRMDEQREVSPLRKAEDAVLLDTTGMTIPQVVERVLQLTEAFANKGS